MPRNTYIQIRRGTFSEWSVENPVLASGEPGFDITHNILKIGDGVNPWLSLLPNASSDLYTYVKNTTGQTLYKGQVVYINGAQGDHPTISLAVASGENTSSKTLGLLKQNLLDNEFGYVVNEGVLEGIDTDLANTAGDTIWLSPTTPGGVLYGSSNKPYAPNHMVFLGYVLRKQLNNGKVYVKVQNGYELEELHNVAVTGATGGQFLQYDGSGLWMPSSSGNFTTLQVSGTSVSLNGHIHNTSNILIGNTLEDLSVLDSFFSGRALGGSLNDAIISDGGIDSFVINDFNSSVSGLLPITNILGGSNISISTSGSVYTISVSGQLGLTAEEVEDEVAGLLVGGSGININYDDNLNALTINSNLTTSLENGSGINFTYDGVSDTLSIALSGHNHTSSDITDLSKTFYQFTSMDNQPPVSSFATIDTRNTILVLDFDDSAVESSVFVGTVPDNTMLTSGITARIAWMATTATSGNVRWRIEFEKGNTDYDSDSFDTAVEATATTSSTAGIPTYTDISSSNIDGLSAGDIFRLKISRVGTDATNDTMAGDAELIAVSIRSN